MSTFCLDPGVEVLPAGADKEEWLEARRAGIGASEIAAVLGISPWDSPFSLYWRKKLGSQFEMTEAMEWGTRHEATIAAKFADNHPEYRIEEAGLYQHAQHEWMLATPDRIAYPLNGSPPMLVQIKTSYSWDGWGTEGTDQVPAYYRAQVIQEMAVYGAQVCWMPVLVGGNSYREYRVNFNPEEFETIRAAGEAFICRLRSGQAPDVDGSAATTATLKQLHPSVVDEVVSIPLELADRYWARRQLHADAKAALDEATNQILAALGNARTAVADGRKIATRSVYDVERVNTKKLKADHPDLCGQYLTTSTVSKLTPAKDLK